MSKLKICSACGKKDQEFARNKAQKDGLQNQCKSCNKKTRAASHRQNYLKNYRKKWYRKNIVAQRDYNLRKRYGISVEEYQALFEKQKGRCAICGMHALEFTRALNVDHSHKTGKVRGLLCHKCNRGLGLFNDDSEKLINAVEYLNENGTLCPGCT